MTRIRRLLLIAAILAPVLLQYVQDLKVATAQGVPTYGLEWPGDGAVRRMLYWHNPFPIYDATYIFKVYPRKKTTGSSRYYTTFFWGNDGRFDWVGGGNANTYYGAHPYPVPAPTGPGQWEISVESNDFTTGSEVQWNRWYTQAFRAWRESSSITHHEFYWDLPDTTKVLTHTVFDSTWAKQNPPTPAIVMGQAPNFQGASWGGFEGWEEFNGIIRGIQIYSGLLSVSDIQAEISAPKSTTAGQNLIWYLNTDPRPGDVTDKKATGTPHNPSWDGTTALEWSDQSGSPDTTPPSAPSSLSAAPSSPTQINLSWTPSTDNVGVTGYKVERCTGSACSNFTEVYTPAGTSQADTGLTANTTYRYRVRATDAAGNLSSYSSIVNGTTPSPTDSTPPAVSITSPAGGATVASTVSVTATASDNVGVVGVQFKLDGANLGSEDASPPYTVSWNTATASNGAHNLTAVARDAAGNQTTSAAVSVTVNNADTTLPTVSITSPAGGTTVAGTITVSGTASDNVGIVGVQFQLDGANLGAEDTTAPYSVSWNTTTASNGAHSLTAVARDAAGNQTSVGIMVTVNNSSAPPPSPPPTATFSIPNAGGESWITTGSPGSLNAGYARVQLDTGGTPLSGLAIFGFRSNGVLLTEAGVPAMPPVSAGRVYVEVNGAANTGIAFANPNNQDAVISFYFTDAAGIDFGQGSFSLSANGHTATFINQPPFNGSPSMLGTFTFTSSLPVGVIAVRGFTNEHGEFLITTLPVSPLGDNTASVLVLPHFADGAGWTTQVVLTNPSDVAISGIAQFYGPGVSGQNAPLLTLTVNGTAGASFGYQIPPHSAVRLVTGNVSPSLQVGTVHIIPAGNTAPTPIAIFSYKAGGVTVNEAGVSTQALGSAFRMYAEVTGRPGQPGSVETAVALANPSPIPITVTLQLVQMDGSSPIAPETVTVPGNGQVAKFISQFFPALTPPFQGLLRVTAGTPVALTVLRTRYNERGDFLLTTTPPSDDTVNQPSTLLVFPQVVSGGGYTTQIMVYGQSSSGKLWLISPSGSPVFTIQQQGP